MLDFGESGLLPPDSCRKLLYRHGLAMSEVVLITGGSAGIGRATALTFARLGYRLAIAARDGDRLTETAIAIEKDTNAEVLAVPTDVANPEQVQALVEKTGARFGPVDILVNNAGICMSGPVTDTTLEQWQTVMNANVWGCIHTIQAILPSMIERKQGTVVNVGSVGSKMPLPYMTAYCTSKYAVAGLTETLRLEVQSQGIQVIGVHPGVVKSDFMDRAIFTDETETSTTGTGSSRSQMQSALDSFAAQTPDDVADAILDAVQTGKTDVIVGWAQVATTAYQWFPGLVGPLLGNAGR